MVPMKLEHSRLIDNSATECRKSVRDADRPAADGSPAGFAAKIDGVAEGAVRVTTGGNGVLRHFYEDPRVPVSSGSGRGLPLADGSVDLVIFSEVIEHLVDTDSAIEELHRVLRPGGRVDGAPYHDVPGVLRPLDRLFCRWPSAASMLVQAQRA
jgi:SAM-dependent methyltransferase